MLAIPNHPKRSVATGVFMAISLILLSGCAGINVRSVDELAGNHPDEALSRPTTVIGFLGGRENYDETTRGVRKLALRIRAMGLPGVHVETFANRNRDLAMAMVRRTLDRNRNGRLEQTERRDANIILFGQSLGGWAVVRMARELYLEGIPVKLSVQVDSVGFTDARIPPNVRQSANLFQRNDFIFRGEPEIVAEDPIQTRIFANIEFDYSNRFVDTSNLPLNRRLFPTPHTKMDADPEVWARVEQWILNEIGQLEAENWVTRGQG